MQIRNEGLKYANSQFFLAKKPDLGGVGQCLILAKPGSTVTFSLKMKHFFHGSACPPGFSYSFSEPDPPQNTKFYQIANKRKSKSLEIFVVFIKVIKALLGGAGDMGGSGG